MANHVLQKLGSMFHRSDSLRILSALWQRFRCR